MSQFLSIRLHLVFFSAFALVAQPAVSFAQTSLEIQVDADSDDAEESDSGSVSLNDTTIELGTQQWVGYRFVTVTIPQGATITSAHLEIRSTNSASSESTDLTIFGQDTDDADTFGSNSNNLSLRPMTNALIDWDNVENWNRNQWYDTPDISAIVQEIVDRPGWVDGNDLVILIRSDDLTGARRARSHDFGGGQFGAKLHVEYNLSAASDHHWAFDEGSGTIAADNLSSADATLQAGATWSSDCLGVSSIEFDGIDDRAVTSQSITPPSSGTIAFWIRSSGLPSASSSIFGLSDSWEARQEVDGALTFNLGSNGSPEFVSATSLGQADRWYHVVAVFDANDDSFEVYVDGQLDTNGINSEDMVAQPADIMSFGKSTGSSDYWKGALKDFHIYTNKLTSAEIADLYGIRAYWKLDETGGTSALDSSVRGNDATYVGSPTLGAAGAYPTATNTSVKFDGISQYVTANASLLNDVEEFTIIGWFNPSDVSPVRSFLGQYNLIEIGIDTASNQLELWTSLGGSINAINKLPVGKWKHIAAVGNGTSLTLYVDGREVATGGTVTATYGNNTEIFKIGEGVMDSADGFYEGRVDDVRVFERAMCADQIYQLYKGGRPPGVRIIKWVEIR